MGNGQSAVSWAGILRGMDTLHQDAPSHTNTPPAHCPRCGSADLVVLVTDEAEPHVFRCAACGTSSRMTRRGVLLPLGWQCDACGHDNERGNHFCTACGTALTKQCPNCGAMMLHADAFCTQCGKSRGQLVAEWYRAGRGALDAGRPWEAIAPLQRIAAVDPEYGDIPNLLARALREAAVTPPLPPVTSPVLPAARALPISDVSRASDAEVSPPARSLRAAFQRAQENPVERRRFLLISGAIGIGVGIVCTIIGVLMGSVAFGVLLFVFLAALFAVNVWSSFRQM